MPNESSARAVPRAAAESHWSDPTATRCDQAQKSVADRMSLFANFAKIKGLVLLDCSEAMDGNWHRNKH